MPLLKIAHRIFLYFWGHLGIMPGSDQGTIQNAEDRTQDGYMQDKYPIL